VFIPAVFSDNGSLWTCRKGSFRYTLSRAVLSGIIADKVEPLVADLGGFEQSGVFFILY